ncbi:MAG TPA: tol-pal system protein YbgF [Myxococcales bacterium]|jgi:tol-pal system protein YbgF|nr:tol-pal system protein YbgF [Myxococcales bacterium]
MKRALLVLFVACSACVTTAQEGEEMRKDIASLHADLKKETDAAAADRTKQADESAARTKALQDALDQLSRAARKSGADLGVDLEKAQNDLVAIHGQMDVLQHRLDAFEKAQADQAAAATAAAAAAAQQKKEAEHPADKMGIYNLGRSKLEAGQTGRARELFAEFLSKFPKDELASNSQYWIGESYYAEKKWNDAIGEFQKVLKQYKGSEKVPDALLKIGMSFQAQNDCGSATLFFEELQQGHKSSEAAKTAKTRLAECKRKK